MPVGANTGSGVPPGEPLYSRAEQSHFSHVSCSQTAPVRGKELLPVISIEILVPGVSRQPSAGWHRTHYRAPAAAPGGCCCSGHSWGPGSAMRASRQRALPRTPGPAHPWPPSTGQPSSWRERWAVAGAQHLSPAEEMYSNITQKCWEIFVDLMRNVTAPELCEWKVISRPYSLLQECLEYEADRLQYGYPNALAEQYIFQSHHRYFQNCTLEHYFDPPEDVLLAMIIAPICLIPFLVTLVIWRSKDSKAHT
ncbi:receptor activity-modifying protein 2 isoform X1 [Heliangelus exortis]|uniref:receptor activity-modifying protein 2 isoform X1 n=1 Tax=Heliangelus exortis TaxID=472823 RepID=UPI003A93ED43